MSKSYHKNSKKFDDDYEEEDLDTKNAKKAARLIRQVKRLKFNEDRDHDT